MKLSKTAEYAIRVMYQMADDQKQIYSVFKLHKQLQIPYKYLGKLMHRLAEAHLLEPSQGKQGGYRLARDDTRIYLYEIIGVVEGLDDYQRCVLGFVECSSTNPCALHAQWTQLREKMQDLIYNVSLAELREKTKNKN